MLEEDEIHQCPVLKANGRYLDYVCKGQGNARWRLVLAKTGSPSSEDEVFMQRVLSRVRH